MLAQNIEDEYKKWTSMMMTESDKISHFSATSNTLFLCVLWKSLMETDEISPLAYKVNIIIFGKKLVKPDPCCFSDPGQDRE